MSEVEGTPEASILVVTYNRLKMLRKCLESILANTDDVSYELIVWNNASDDGTKEYLDEMASKYPQIRPVHSKENIGVNAVAETVKLAKGFYLIEMDDDVLEVPKGWLREMIRAFNKVPRAGYLAANVVQDENTDGAKPPIHFYRIVDYGDGVVIEHGPTGGWCTITSREVIEKIGNFLQMPGRIFFAEDGDFVNRCMKNSYYVGIIRNVKVYHATGVKMNKKFGYLDICKLKYSDDPAYKPWLEATLKEMGEHEK